MPTCRVNGCGHPRRDRELVCRRCWRLIPARLRTAVVTSRDPRTIEAAAAHLTAVDEAIAAAQTALTTRPAGD